MSPEEREAMILTLSVMTFKEPAYFDDMDDRRLCQEYDRYMKVNEG